MFCSQRLVRLLPLRSLGAVTPKVTNTSPTASTISFRGQAPDYLEPMVNEANAAVERELPGDMSCLGNLFVHSRAAPPSLRRCEPGAPNKFDYL